GATGRLAAAFGSSLLGRCHHCGGLRRGGEGQKQGQQRRMGEARLAHGAGNAAPRALAAAAGSGADQIELDSARNSAPRGSTAGVAPGSLSTAGISKVAAHHSARSAAAALLLPSSGPKNR